MSTDQSPDIRVALLWDKPMLQRSKTSGAEAFVGILDLRWAPDDEASLLDSHLGRAAVGLHRALSADTDAGHQHFDVLISQQGDDSTASLARLLGRALKIWTSKPDRVVEEIEVASSEVARQDDDELKALYLAKLAGFAFDAGHRALGLSLLDLCLGHVPSDRPRLRWYIERRAASERGQLLFTPRPDTDDPLADFPWIGDAASSRAQQALVEFAETEAEDPWIETLHFGSTRVDLITALSLQAEWAGALWLLPALRLQQAATTMLARGRDVDEWERALANWVLGGGKRLRDVVRLTEPHLTVGSVRRIVDERLVRGRALSRPDRYIDFLLSAWDLMDDEVATSVLDEFHPVSTGRVGVSDVNALWAIVGALVPERWADRFIGLAREQQAALLENLSLGLVERLPESAVAVLGERCAERLEAVGSLPADRGSDDGPYMAASHLVRASGADSDVATRLMPRLRNAPRIIQADLCVQIPDLANEFGVDSLMAEMLDRLRTKADEARRGRYSADVRPPDAAATNLAIAFPDRPQASDIAVTIAQLAGDATLLSDLRTDVLQQLYRLALSRDFEVVLGEHLGGATTTSDHSFHTRDSRDFQRALWETASLLVAPTNAGMANVLAVTRADDPRVREVAVVAIGHLADGLRDIDAETGLLCWSAVVGALFDPTSNVVRQALGVIAAADHLPGQLSPMVSDRLVHLYEHAGRDVRVGVVHACTGRLGHDALDDRHGGILEQAAADRSWLVRDALRVATDR